ncbi:hypothetical protein CEXT_373091 [Caerostris extrusa]|uniref:Uncharacterized protein n=1 Tax=Caerostris extrusa TaxID=172846 RepID=A0AAV4UBK9_CAEEX|nr:hypothetical protein CEXT_373091 [Caerostris extrusa]
MANEKLRPDGERKESRARGDGRVACLLNLSSMGGAPRRAAGHDLHAEQALQQQSCNCHQEREREAWVKWFDPFAEAEI